jgi:hypothetical protein
MTRRAPAAILLSVLLAAATLAAAAITSPAETTGLQTERVTAFVDPSDLGEDVDAAPLAVVLVGAIGLAAVGLWVVLPALGPATPARAAVRRAPARAPPHR